MNRDFGSIEGSDFMQPCNTNNDNLDTLAILASVFWLAGSVLTLYIAVELSKRNKPGFDNNIFNPC